MPAPCFSDFKTKFQVDPKAFEKFLSMRKPIEKAGTAAIKRILDDTKREGQRDIKNHMRGKQWHGFKYKKYPPSKPSL